MKAISIKSLYSLLAVVFCASGISSQETIDYESPPILYGKTKPRNPVQTLKESLDSGNIVLKSGTTQELLLDLLAHLNLPRSSQVLSYAKHSLQSHHISPDKPRAIFFADGVYLGYVQGDDGLIEIATHDPILGCVFYIASKPTNQDLKPKIERETNRCMTCHGGNRSRGVPGVMVRSVFVSPEGQPVLSAGGFRTDHTSPLKHRWGGWYVTGNSGSMEHLGNFLLTTKKKPAKVDNSSGMNRDSLPMALSGKTLEPTSDIAALMILEHETDVVNYITRLIYQYRIAGEPVSTVRWEAQLEGAVNDLVGQLLFVGELPLTNPIRGSQKYRVDFENRGPKTKEGTSLRQWDMQTRMFKYPLSYMVQSRAFQDMPDPVRNRVWAGIHAELTKTDPTKRLTTANDSEKAEILRIVKETIQPLPDFWIVIK